MPLKKKGKKGSKKKKKSAKADDETGAVDTAVGDLQPDGTLKPSSAKGKKKKKKKKLTKSERAALKLEKAMNAYMSQEEHYRNFIDRMDRWFTNKENLKRTVALFEFYKDGEEVLTYDEFKAGMRDLNAPCNLLELHILAKLLDKDDAEEVNYKDFAGGLKFVREALDAGSDSSEEEEELEENPEAPVEGTTEGGQEVKKDAASILFGSSKPTEEEEIPQEEIKITGKLILSERKTQKCAGCKMGICEPYKPKNAKFISLALILVTFEKKSAYPVHIERLVHAHMTIAGLISIIKEEVAISSSTITIFRDRSRDPESALSPSDTLEECGFKGRNYDDPEPVCLFYDYIVEFVDCPLLMCDHYMRKVEISSKFQRGAAGKR